MPPARQRLVRRRPLLERIRGALNPSDFLLWASEEIKTRDLDSKPVGTRLSLLCNFVFLLARANSRAATTGDDVFSEQRFSWVTLFAKQLVWLLTLASIINSVALLYQTRRYRLFEANVEQRPGTPSAQRVRVQSSPMSSSPLRLLTDAFSSETAESRAHPDRTRDVWEIAVWDPIPACLQGLAFFSPVHVLLYLFELPLDPMDRRPSVTVFKCLALQICLSWMLGVLQSTNDRRLKDSTLIQSQVLREYDAKFVHPRLHPLVREVGIQASVDEAGHGHDIVEVGAATTLLRRGFQTHPNPNYIGHIDPDNAAKPVQTSNVVSNRLSTPVTKTRHSDSFAVSQQSARARARQSMPAVTHTPLMSASTSSLTQSTSTGTSPAPPAGPGNMSTTNFGGSLGVYTHANSPLKKATSLNDINSAGGFGTPRNSREMAGVEQHASEYLQRGDRASSPLKQQHVARPDDEVENHSAPVPNPFLKNRPNRYTMERYPSRW